MVERLDENCPVAVGRLQHHRPHAAEILDEPLRHRTTLKPGGRVERRADISALPDQIGVGLHRARRLVNDVEAGVRDSRRRCAG